MFIGYAQLDQAFVTYFLCRDQNDVPIQADSLPTWQVYGPDGPMTNGSGSAQMLVDITGFYRAVIPVMGSNGYELGTTYKVLVDYLDDGVGRALEQSFTVT